MLGFVTTELPTCGLGSVKRNPAELDDLLTVIVTKTLGTDSPDTVGQIRQLIAKQLGPEYDWPGNVRELAQCVRRLLLNRTYTGFKKQPARRLPTCQSTGKQVKSTLRALSKSTVIPCTGVTALTAKSRAEPNSIAARLKNTLSITAVRLRAPVCRGESFDPEPLNPGP